MSMEDQPRNIREERDHYKAECKGYARTEDNLLGTLDKLRIEVESIKKELNRYVIEMNGGGCGNPVDWPHVAAEVCRARYLEVVESRKKADKIETLTAEVERWDTECQHQAGERVRAEKKAGELTKDVAKLRSERDSTLLQLGVAKRLADGVIAYESMYTPDKVLALAKEFLKTNEKREVSISFTYREDGVLKHRMTDGSVRET